MPRRLTRRQTLLAGSSVVITSLVAACSASPPATPTTTSAPTAAASGATTAPAATVPATAQASRPTAAPARPTTAPSSAASTTTSQSSSAPAVPTVPRNETLIVSVSDSLNQMNDATIANPFLLGAQRTGWQFAFEPLYFYNCWWTNDVTGPPGLPGKGGEIPYLATGYHYNNTYDQLTINLRPQVTWSDGQPFTANDIVFTINMLKNNAPKLTFSNDMKLWIKDVAAVDDHTVDIHLTSPNPSFMFEYFEWYLDHGFPFVPEHIFKDQDPLTFTNLDLAKGWPITTGPWTLIYSDPQQKVWERRDDWWGA